ncbi:SusD/RagB family nutrient-binding outer membrane lipoprotein [Elizabethkingia anophelis]|uniref:SusD/RagB family nutrient-binding outer membrane lipoprotein n=1 Tax=Elizabethkingia anophelis TaxID=1117645 RepID=UPI003892C0AA
MKKIINIVSVLAVVLSITSCEGDISSMNTDPKHPSVLPSGSLLAMGTNQEFYYMYSGSVFNNNYRFFTQQWSEVTYTDESNYNLTTNNQSRAHYNRMMVYTLNNFNQGMKNLELEVNTPAVKNNKWVTLELSSIYTWENLVDTFGDVPYTEALNAAGNAFSPKYDDAKAIYMDLFRRIDNAIAKIDLSASGYTSEDLVYKGNMGKWKKMANSLKLRLAMNLADVDPATSKKYAEEAYASGLLTASDNYQLTFDGTTFFNPLYDDVIGTGRFDFVPSDRVINLMNAKNDPRRAVWFLPLNGTTDKYAGGIYGSSSSPALPSPTLSVFTGFFTSKTGPATLMSYTEVQFLLAEAAARGYSVGGTAATYYASAVTASMTESGIGSSAAAYLVANPFDATNWQKSIGEEAYIGLFNKGLSTWNFTRRLDYPKSLVNPPASKIDGLPVRMPYSDQEYTLNKTNVSAAASKIGGDKASTKLFWDKN